MISTFTISGMTCARCVAHAQAALLKGGFSSVVVTLAPAQVVIDHTQVVSVVEVNELLADTSYRAHSLQEERSFLYKAIQQIRHFAPLITMFALVSVFTLAHGFWYDFSLHTLMQFFMAGYFLFFGALKVARWRRFVLSYRAYDDLAKRSRIYAWAYPALEIIFGLYYYVALAWWPVDVLVALLMTQKAYSTWSAVRKGAVVQCACLGSFFAIPVSRVTVFEDLLMALMAVYMISHYL